MNFQLQKKKTDLRFIIKCSKEPTRSWPELRSNVCLTIIVFIKNNHPCVCILKRTIIDLLWNPTKELPIHADHGNSFVMSFLGQNFIIFLYEGVVNLSFREKNIRLEFDSCCVVLNILDTVRSNYSFETLHKVLTWIATWTWSFCNLYNNKCVPQRVTTALYEKRFLNNLLISKSFTPFKIVILFGFKAF